MPALSQADLAGVELLNGIDGKDLQELLAVLQPRDLAAGSVVFQAGSSSRSLYILLSGTVEIELVAAVAEGALVAQLSPKSVFGESTFFHPADHATTARCLTAVRLAELERTAYDGLIQRRAVAAYHLAANAAEILSARLQNADRWVREILDADEKTHRDEVRRRFRESFHPALAPPRGYFRPNVS